MLQSCQLRAPCSQQHTCVARRPSRFPSQHQQRRPVLVSAAQPNRDFGVNPLRRNDADIQANPLYNPKPGEAPAAGTTGYSPPPDMYPGHGVVPNVPPGVPYTVDAQGNQVPNFEGAAIGAVAAALSSMDGSSNPGPGVSVEWTQWMPPSPTGSMDGGQPPNPNPLSSMDGSNQPNPNPMSSIDDGKPPVPVPNPMYSMDGGQPASAKQPSAVKATPREMPYVPSGAPETTWYCWPEGYVGQSFSLQGKLEPRASPLLEDVDTLAQYAMRRREMCRYSEHTIDSANVASQMVQAVVGGAVDLGMLNASGSASFQMSRDLSSRSVSHNIVASFQENELLEMLRPSLSPAAKQTLIQEGPQVFAARYGTHFVSGVGHRGAFIGSITVKLSDVKMAAAASASFKASYKTVSTMAELKASMEQSLQTSDVTFTWHKWGVADDSALDLLEEYCGSDAARFSGMRALAMHTADSAQGYPKLIKLRPYSTLPDYVEACSKYCEANRQEPLGELQDLEQALSYLTKQYRKASYIMQVIENDQRLNVLNGVTNSRQQAGSLAYRVKTLLQLMERVFRSKDSEEVGRAGTPFAQPSMYLLRVYFKYHAKPAGRPDPDAEMMNATRLKDQLDQVDKLDFELFKAVQRPITMSNRNPNQANVDLSAQLDRPGNPPMYPVHIAAVSDSNPAAPFGRWYLDYMEQETFTKPGLYLVRLAVTRVESQRQGEPAIQRLEQVGRTQRWEVTGAASGVGSVNATIYDMQRYLEDCLSPTQNPGMMGAKPGDNVFILFAVGVNITVTDTQTLAARNKIEQLTGIPVKGIMVKADTVPISEVAAGSMGSWAAIGIETKVGGVNKRVSTRLSSPPAANMPVGMVMAELTYYFFG